MHKNNLERAFDKIVAYLGLLTFCSVVALYSTACIGPAGYGVSGRAEVYRLDEQSGQSRTVQAQTKPFKCHFTGGPDCEKKI